MSSAKPTPLRHPIGVVVRRTGLKADLVRAWERRYGAVVPHRSETDRRLYSEEDIQRLQLLRDATGLGHPISQLAPLPGEELERLVRRSLVAAAAATERPVPDSKAPPLERCLSAIGALDAATLRHELELAYLDRSLVAFVEEILVPLMERVGELWHEGDLRPAHEHMASAVVRSVVVPPMSAGDKGAPRLVAATPQGQRHELGLALAATVAFGEGWEVVYLGADLPAASIAEAVASSGSAAVALSITIADAEPTAEAELRSLLGQLAGTPVLLGGRMAAGVADEIGSRRVVAVGGLAAFRAALATLAVERRNGAWQV